MNEKRYLGELPYHGGRIVEMYFKEDKKKFEITKKLKITYGTINYWLKQVKDGKVIPDYKDNNGKEK